MFVPCFRVSELDLVVLNEKMEVFFNKRHRSETTRGWGRKKSLLFWLIYYFYDSVVELGSISRPDFPRTNCFQLDQCFKRSALACPDSAVTGSFHKPALSWTFWHICWPWADVCVPARVMLCHANEVWTSALRRCSGKSFDWLLYALWEIIATFFALSLLDCVRVLFHFLCSY